MNRPISIFLLLLLLVAGCALPGKMIREMPPAVPLVLVTDSAFPLLADDLDPESMKLAIVRSLEFLEKRTTERYRFGDREYTADDMRDSLISFRDIIGSSDTDDIKMQKIREGFDVYKATGSDGRGTVIYTGYYKPVLNGSLEETEQYKYPLYKAPPELTAKNPDHSKANGLYFSREDIDVKRVLANRNLEIAWVDDPVDLFSLHIQGSGRIRLPDGKTIEVSYARNNGRPFRSITEFMVETGTLPAKDKSYWTVKKYLKEHPEDRQRFFNYNERYIFFRVVNGAIGALGVPVTGGRSIAVDPAVFPRVAVAFIRLRKPLYDQEGNRKGWAPFSRFVLSQDVGTAIRGAGRIDLFCGEGDDAERFAGSLREKGELYFLMKKQ